MTSGGLARRLRHRRMNPRSVAPDSSLPDHLRAALVVCFQGDIGLSQIEEGLGELFTELAHFTNTLVAEHVDIVPIKGPVGRKPLGDRITLSSAEPCIGQTGDSPIDNTTGQGLIAPVNCIAATARGQEAILELVRCREPVCEGDLIIQTVMGIREADVAVIEDRVGIEVVTHNLDASHPVRHDRGWIERDTLIESSCRGMCLDIRRGTDIIGTSRTRGGEGGGNAKEMGAHFVYVGSRLEEAVKRQGHSEWLECGAPL